VQYFLKKLEKLAVSGSNFKQKFEKNFILTYNNLKIIKIKTLKWNGNIKIEQRVKFSNFV
jgi:hypothetical protein